VRAYFDRTQPYGIRLQPWETADYAEGGRYYDFRKEPALIAEVLEDFVPLADYESVQQFYELLRWMNGPDSPYETNDSRLRPPRENRQRDLADKALVRDGMLMFFFRDLPLNLSADSVAWSRRFHRYEIDQHEIKPTPNDLLLRFGQRCVEELSKINPDSQDDCVGVLLMPALFVDAPVHEDSKYGNQFVLRFLVWGDTDGEIMSNLTRTVAAISTCLKTTAAEVPEEPST
jgi:hypothetical protein